MNKILFPSILVATVMIAGIFAMLPIQEASTVHTTIQNTQMNQTDSEYSTDINADPIVCTADGSDFIIHASIEAVADLSTVTLTDGTNTVTVTLQANNIVDELARIAFTFLGTASQTITITGAVGASDGHVGIIAEAGATNVDCD